MIKGFVVLVFCGVMLNGAALLITVSLNLSEKMLRGISSVCWSKHSCINFELEFCSNNELKFLISLFFVKVTNINTPKTQEDEFIEIQSDTGTAFQRWTVRHLTMLQQVCRPPWADNLEHRWTQMSMLPSCLSWSVCLSFLQVMANIMSLSAPELRLQGLFLVIVWFCLAFRFCAGLLFAFIKWEIKNNGIWWRM